MSSVSFTQRLAAAMDDKRSAVCVGIDPRFDSLPAALRGAQRGNAEAQAAAFEEFGLGVIEAVAEHAVAIKPQAAFFERLRAPGFAAFTRLCAAARERGLMVVADVKRGDIGTTAEAYAEAYLGGDEFEPMADACTVNAYLGSDGVKPFVQQAVRHGGGIFVLVKTSNKSSAELQDLEINGQPLCERMAALVDTWNQPRDASGYGPVGAVVGATWPGHLERLRALLPASVLLLPGYGAQGAGAADVLPGFDAQGRGALVTASRSVTFPWGSKEAPSDWRGMIGTAAAAMRAEIYDALNRSR